ncbi:regulatory protein RecX [bacterium]|nr:regulatory protein RecX [bacterium]
MKRSDHAYYKERACQILAAREHSAAELFRKLLQRGCPADTASQVVAGLIDAGLIDDVRFAVMLLRSKFRQGWGWHRVLAELRKRGVGDEAIAAVVSECADELGEEREEERAAEIVRRRMHSAADADKVLRYLLNHGFSAVVSRRVVTQYLECNREA